jgi:hypothetical protein
VEHLTASSSSSLAHLSGWRFLSLPARGEQFDQFPAALKAVKEVKEGKRNQAASTTRAELQRERLSLPS